MGYQKREDLNVVSERAILVALTLYGEKISLDERFAELAALTESAGGEVVGHLTQKRRLPRGKTFVGKGKLEELRSLAESTNASVIIFDHDLTPAQIRNVERETEKKIIDRSELILDIFSSRAATAEARLQVEIAQLEYTYPRLRAMWDHLGQVTGGSPVGIGTRGPGEQQLEIDRRLVQRRLKQLRRELEALQLRSVREVAKRNTDHFTVGLVGYTNAGKSTLFNTLTSGGAWSHDQLFATLSTRIERWELGGGVAAMLSDTVGFVRRLPHHLVASFRSTLEETVNCQLLLVVVDASDPAAAHQLQTVETTLQEIGATEQPRIVLLNKIDRVTELADTLVLTSTYPEAIQLSAVTEEGVGALEQEVRSFVLGPVREVELSLNTSAGKAIDFIEKRTEVLRRDWKDGRTLYKVKLGQRQLGQLMTRGGDLFVNNLPATEAEAQLWPSDPTPDSCCQIPPHRMQDSTEQGL
ncbi:MAG: GTPase HflX [Phycisphaerales bacterium]|jgi:GTP-binding protein HflX|nr:GTPase HflX [Phycisphaerales bacterium]